MDVGDGAAGKEQQEENELGTKKTRGPHEVDLLPELVAR